MIVTMMMMVMIDGYDHVDDYDDADGYDQWF